MSNRAYASVARHNGVNSAQCIELASADVSDASDAPRGRTVDEHDDRSMVVVMLATEFEQEIDGRRRDAALLGTCCCVSRQGWLHVAPSGLVVGDDIEGRQAHVVSLGIRTRVRYPKFL